MKGLLFALGVLAVCLCYFYGPYARVDTARKRAAAAKRALLESEYKGVDLPILQASMMGDEEDIKIMLAADEDVNVQNKGGYTPLLLAAYYNHPNIIRILLESGANRHAKNMLGKTALQIATEKGHDQCLAILKLESSTWKPYASACTAFVVIGTSSVFFFVATAKRGKRGVGPELNRKETTDDAEEAILQKVIEDSLKQPGASSSAIVAAQEKYPRLLEALEARDEDAAEPLLAGGADPNETDARKRNALHVAAEKGCRPSLFKMILDKIDDVNATDQDGKTALGLAVSNGRFDGRDVLISLMNDRRIDLKNDQDVDIQTALKYMVAWNEWSIDAILAAMQHHRDSTMVQRYGCEALWKKADENADENAAVNRRTIARKGGKRVISDAMQQHRSSSRVREYGSDALRAIEQEANPSRLATPTDDAEEADFQKVIEESLKLAGPSSLAEINGESVSLCPSTERELFNKTHATKVPIRGDGHCAYHAISKGLAHIRYRNASIYDFAYLRRLVGEMDKVNYDGEWTLENQIAVDRAKKGEWAHDTELQMLSTILDICLVVYRADSHDRRWTFITPKPSIDVCNDNNVIYLINNGGEWDRQGTHFDLLVNVRRE